MCLVDPFFWKCLQFLVSKLVDCCIPSLNQGSRAEVPSPKVITLLHQLTVDADPLLEDNIRVSVTSSLFFRSLPPVFILHYSISTVFSVLCNLLYLI